MLESLEDLFKGSRGCIYRFSGRGSLVSNILERFSIHG